MSPGLRAAAGSLFLLLSACASVPPKSTSEAAGAEAYAARAATISSWSDWGFLGRLSMDDGEDGGSGRLEWQTRGDSAQLDFRGTLGRGAWRLSVQPGEAVLERADGSRTVAASVEELVFEELGWGVPVDALAWWVRGLRAPGRADQVEIDGDGQIVRLAQEGWSIVIERYRDVSGIALPGRIEAVRGSLRLKLVPARWTTPAPSDGHGA